MAVLTGRLLDEVDKLVSTAIGSGQEFFSWLDNDYQDELWLTFKTEDYYPIKDCLERGFIRLEEKLPWLKKKPQEHQILGFFCRNGELLRYWVEEIKVDRKSDRKKARHYSRISAREIDRRQSYCQDDKRVNQKIAKVNEILDDRLKTKHKLTHSEELWMPHRGDYCKETFQKTPSQEA